MRIYNKSFTERVSKDLYKNLTIEQCRELRNIAIYKNKDDIIEFLGNSYRSIDAIFRCNSC